MKRNFKLNSQLATRNSKLTLALDPSLHVTGYAFVDSNEKVIHTGIIKTSPKTPEAKRLAELMAELHSLILKYLPEDIAIELPFSGLNPQTTMKLAGVRAVILLLGEQAGIPVAEYTTFEVKGAITGNNAAGKDQVRRGVKAITGIIAKSHHISDAIAVGLCHRRRKRWKEISQRKTTTG